MTQSLPFSRRGILAGLASSLALAACNPVRYAAPQAEVAARFAANSPARRAGANAWWAAFRDSR
ncbi:RND transporter, partial [Paracoccus thiocyanatus]